MMRYRYMLFPVLVLLATVFGCSVPQPLTVPQFERNRESKIQPGYDIVQKPWQYGYILEVQKHRSDGEAWARLRVFVEPDSDFEGCAIIIQAPETRSGGLLDKSSRYVLGFVSMLDATSRPVNYTVGRVTHYCGFGSGSNNQTPVLAVIPKEGSDELEWDNCLGLRYKNIATWSHSLPECPWALVWGANNKLAVYFDDNLDGTPEVIQYYEVVYQKTPTGTQPAKSPKFVLRRI